ncbi:M16 family metallopeptidase [Polyangium spumosum]|uniref:Insulinase family protein n=1 Tax=Polyangium spumosum TaxID=889282 RepID=A0A6N7PVA4_9BACT|nr:M16 family metallopeptidase [Polyangium spumosum]MRG94185.1 hypothetical protein [Polyangium spumosum]
MRAPKTLLAALLLSLAGCSPSLVPPRQGLAMRNVSFPLHDLKFPSGLRVLLEEDHRMPLVGTFLVVGAGSSSDPPGKEGLAHFIEHLTFRSRPFGKSSMKRLLERAGVGQWNAYTGFDDTVYFEIGPAASLGEMLGLEGARMLAPVSKITPETLAVELDVVRNELRQRNETGFIGEVFGAMQAALFPPGHPYARPVIGTRESLGSIQTEDIAAFLQKQYRPDNMTLVIVGDVDPAQAGALVEKSLPKALLEAPAPVKIGPRLPAVAPEPPPPPPQGPLTRKEANVTTPELWIGWSLPRSFDTSAYVAGFVEAMAEARLDAAEREDGDIMGISTRLIEGTQASMLLCRVVLKNGGHPERSKEHVLNQLHRLWGGVEGGAAGVLLDADRFAASKRRAVVQMVLQAEHIGARGLARAEIGHFSGDPAIYTRALANVAALEPQRLTDYARRYLTRERARAVLFAPPASGAKPVEATPISAPVFDEEDRVPMRVDEQRLVGMAPTPGVSAYSNFTLPNGMEVFLGRREGLPLVTVAIGFRGGLQGTADIAGARVGMMLAQPRDRWHGDPAAFGGRWSLSHAQDRSSYRITGAAGNVGIMIGILGERVRSMEIDRGRWAEFERTQVPFLRLVDRKPEVIGERSLLQALFQGHVYGRTATAEDVAGSGVSAGQAWIDATHAPKNATLVVVGEIDPVAVEKIVRDQFEGWESKAAVEEMEHLDPGRVRQEPRFLTAHRPGATQADVHFACLLPPAPDKATDVRHDVGARIVGIQLEKALRQRLGATYGVDAGSFVMRGGVSRLEIRSAVENAKLAEVIGELSGTLARLAETPVSSHELAEAKLAEGREESTRYMTHGAIVSALVASRSAGFSPRDIDEHPKYIARVTAEAVKEDFGSCFAGRPTILIVGDEPTVKAAIAASKKPKAEAPKESEQAAAAP